MIEPRLYMILLGCKPKGRHTEQHDIFFGIGLHLKDLLPDIIQSWPEAEGKLHIDAWRTVTHVEGHSIAIVEKSRMVASASAKENALFFLNLGGYKENEFEEFHYKMLVVEKDLDAAKAKAKKALFYKHTTIEQSVNNQDATSHIDDKYGIDVDDMYNIQDILPDHLKEKYGLEILPDKEGTEDPYHLGYTKLDEILLTGKLAG